MDHQSRMRSIPDAASLTDSGDDMLAVLRHLIIAAYRHANWAMGSIMGTDEPHGQAFDIVRYDATMFQPQLPMRWELATSPAILALRRNEPIYIRDARMSDEFPGFPLPGKAPMSGCGAKPASRTLPTACAPVSPVIFRRPL